VKFFIIFIAAVLYAGVNVYLPKKANISLPIDYNCVKYNYINEIDLNNSLAIVDYNKLDWIIKKKDVQIITPIENLDQYIVSKVPFETIHTIANPTLPVKIFFSALSDEYEYINIPFKEFIYSNVDAIIRDKKAEGFYNYSLKKLGMDFNRYFLIGKINFIKRHKKDIDFLNFYLLENYKGNPKNLYESLILTSYYLNKKIDLCNKLTYKCQSEIFKKSKVLKVIVTPNWPPFDIYEKGHLKGIGIDFWKLIAKKAKLEYEFEIEPVWVNVLNAIKNKKADLTPNTSETPDRKKFAIFSKPYVEFPLAIVCKSGTKIDNVNDISSIAVGYNFTAHKLMKKHFPNLRYISAKNTKEALEFVKRGKAQCAVDILPTIVWYVNKYRFLNMEIIKTTDFKFKLQVMIRNDLPEIKTKIDKAIEQITPEEKNEIINRYLGIKIKENKYNLAFIFIILVFSVLFVIVILKTLRYRSQAQIDALTGILNRGTIEKRLKKLTKKTHGSVIFFDIDYFKRINDTYGHEFGDYVLQNLSKLIKQSIRSSDYFGRWGGEEFLIILPETEYENALKIAEKLRKKIAVHSFKGVKITSSFGVSEFKKGDNPENIIQKADKALYEAKKSGRNQVKGIK